MTSKRTEQWDLGDFQGEFRHLAERSKDGTFREKFGALADALEPMTREFVRETWGCGHDLGALLGDLSEIAARDRYCDRPRGFEETCGSLYGDVDAAIRKAEEFRNCCFQ